MIRLSGKVQLLLFYGFIANNNNNNNSHTFTCVAQDKHGPDSNAVEVPAYFTQQSNVKWVEMQQFH
jgi:hypothetical protein